MTIGSRERPSSLLLAGDDAGDHLRPILHMRLGRVLVSRFSLNGAPRPNNGWSERAKEILRRETIIYDQPVFASNPWRCAYCGSRSQHLDGCGNPILRVVNAIED